MEIKKTVKNTEPRWYKNKNARLQATWLSSEREPKNPKTPNNIIIPPNIKNPYCYANIPNSESYTKNPIFINSHHTFIIL